MTVAIEHPVRSISRSSQNQEDFYGFVSVYELNS